MNHLFRLLSLLLFTFCYSIAYSINYSFTRPIRFDSISKQVEYKPLQIRIGFGTGWEAPYGTGMEFSFLFKEIVDANIGCGLSISGAKVGLGTRFFPIRDKIVSPMIGMYLYHSTGMHNLNVSVNEDKGVFRILSADAVLINAGCRFRLYKANFLIAAIGYSFPFKNEKAQYISGSTSSAVQTFANLISTGGLSVNMGILLNLSGGHDKNKK